ncbi:hypothetical protein CP10743SC13_1871 [Chlamydia psittaci 10_743_SC13]|nr:hypothetical protein CP10743SC13_1871 [Chlamydia psittaci 10_743_SC13]
MTRFLFANPPFKRKSRLFSSQISNLTRKPRVFSSRIPHLTRTSHVFNLQIPRLSGKHAFSLHKFAIEAKITCFRFKNPPMK